jgi:uncharacterized membrane protein
MPADTLQQFTPPPPDTTATPDTSRAEFESMISAWEAAKAKGVSFRGVGQEPGWVVDVFGDPLPKRIELVADYGSIKISFEEVTREDAAESRTVYKSTSGSHTIEIEVTPESCTDSMSGQAYPNTVVARLDGRELRGCGKQL